MYLGHLPFIMNNSSRYNTNHWVHSHVTQKVTRLVCHYSKLLQFPPIKTTTTERTCNTNKYNTTQSVQKYHQFDVMDKHKLRKPNKEWLIISSPHVFHLNEVMCHTNKATNNNLQSLKFLHVTRKTIIS
jgi:hypothetical protein